MIKKILLLGVILSILSVSLLYAFAVAYPGDDGMVHVKEYSEKEIESGVFGADLLTFGKDVKVIGREGYELITKKR